MASTSFSLVGLPQSTSHARTIIYSQDQYDFICALSLSGEEDAAKKIEEIEEKCLRTLPFSAEDVYTLVTEIVDKYSKSVQCAIILKNREVVVSASYNGIVALVRNKRSGFLLANTGDVQLVSGKWKENDIYTVSTQAAAESVDEIQAKLQQGLDIQYIINEQSNIFHEKVETTVPAICVIAWNIPELSAPLADIHVNDIPPGIITEVRQREVDKIDHTTNVRTFPKVPFYKMSSFLEDSQKYNKKNVFAVSVITVIALISIYFLSSYLQKRTAAIERLNVQLHPYHQQIDEIKNNTHQNTFEKKNSLTTIIQQLQDVKSKTENTEYLQKMIDVEIEYASKTYDTTSQTGSVTTIPEFINVRDIKSNFIASEIELVDQEIILVDNDTSTLLFIDINSKSNEAATIEKNTKIKVASLGEQVYVLDNSILSVSRTDETTTTEEIIKTDEHIQKAALISAYDNYIYILDKEKRNIYRYIRAKNETNKPISWLKSAKGLDFSTITDMAVDGTVWLSTSNGQVYNFLQGNEQGFTIRQLSPEFNSSLKLYTSSENQNVYILEPEQRRVVVINKQGQFIKEIKHDSFASATDLVASEQANSIFILNGSVVSQVPIK